MRVSTHPAIVYSSSGGMPPRGLELLTVEEDLGACYLAANPWPVQPPFDEIGWYQGRIEETDWKGLVASFEALWEVPDVMVPGSSDVRRDYLEANVEGRRTALEWPFPSPPAEVEPVVGRLRALISELRDSPLCSVLAAVEWNGRDEPDGLSVRLKNRGGDPFLFYDFEAAPEGTRGEIRIAARDPSTPEIGPGLPVGLVGQEPMRVANPPQLTPSSEGLAELPPGQAVMVSLPPAEVRERLPVAPAGAGLACLLRVCFPRTSLDGEPFVQEGWVLTGGVDHA